MFAALNILDGTVIGRHAERCRSGVCESIEELKKSILDFIELHNGREAKPAAGPQAPSASSPHAEEGII